MNTQINTAYRKINNLLSSGAVTVTGPNQPRILKHKIAGSGTNSAGVNSISHGTGSVSGVTPRCYVCDDIVSTAQAQHQMTDMLTTHTSTKFPNKLGQLVGEAFVVIVSSEDLICSRCTNLINYWDRLENDVERVRNNLINLLHKKYGINDDTSGGSEGTPPLKQQKLVAGIANRTVEDVNTELNRARKVLHTSGETVKQTAPVSAVQQMKIATPVQQTTAGTQTVQRKATKIYKCTSCDYKTSDMRLFNTHFETCKIQTFQCKTCKRIFPNFGAMKQHMIRDHNTPMDNTCAVCHINFVNEAALRKHMEVNHATNVLVTSTTTIPAALAAVGANANSDGISATVSGANANTTALYTCNHCQFKSTDKTCFDDHMRKHLGKPKPFKCRLCSQRFETRDAATIHAKQHQTNYFKCGTCSMSFPKRELLVKHFEANHSSTGGSSAVTQTQQVTTVAKQQQALSPQNVHTTQKLLQETIDEALSESVNTANEVSVTGVENNIRFFSCHICSLTFIQEIYYNHHMETHRRDKKAGAPLNSAATALLSDETADGAPKADGDDTGEQSAEADIESIFEKMHSEKTDAVNSEDIVTTTVGNTKTTNSKTTGNENLVITSQEGTGGITFNVTIPSQDGGTSGQEQKAAASDTATVSMSIDMPVLDQPDEDGSTHQSGDKSDKQTDEGMQNSNAAPVSMPSLDDDNDSSDQTAAASSNAENKTSEAIKGDDNQSISDDGKLDGSNKNASGELKGENVGSVSAESENAANPDSTESGDGIAAVSGEGEHIGEGNEQHVAMELDDSMQAQVESGQIKFIVNENGQLLQLDNHILTDADGNQILVQDPEQIQQLLQSVGVLQSGEGLDGETIQMMTDANGQMVLVQGEHHDPHLIDASLLNSDGQLIIQQGQDGEEGAHVISDDGTRIPVSVSYTADGQPIVQVQQQALEAAEGHEGVLDKDAAGDSTGHEGDDTVSHANDATSAGGATSSANSSATAGTGGYFTLEEFIPQSSEAKAE